MVEEDAIHGIHAVALAVVLGNPESILLRHAIGTARIEGSGLLLWHLLHLSEELGGGSLIDFGLFLQTEDAHSLQHAQCAHGIGFGCIFGHVKRYFDVALCSEVINLVGLYLLDDADERAAVGHVAIVQVDGAFLLHVAHPLVEIEMFNASCVE